MGSHVFDRKERVADALLTLTPQRLLAFADEVLRAGPARRKAVVAVHSAKTCATAAAAAPAGSADTASIADVGQEQPGALFTCGVGASGGVVRVHDVADFRRCSEAWPSVGGLYARWRRQGLVPCEQVVANAKLGP
jgi:hypothetical protein